MRINYRMKRSTRQYMIVAVICIVIIGGASLSTTVFVTNQMKGEYSDLLNDARNDMEQNLRSVYVAQIDIAAGEVITENNVVKTEVYSSQPQRSFITAKELGQMALINLPADTQIITTMLTDNIVSAELREVEYQVLQINSNIMNNDTIDVRIIFPNGESLVVLSKKEVKGFTEGSLLCYLWLNTEEILRMSAAIVDAALYPGTQLITTKYIEPSIQDASEVTYNPNLAILELLETDPNILEKSSQELEKEVRKALENRLADSMNTEVSEINWDINPNRNGSDRNTEQHEMNKPVEVIESSDIEKEGNVPDELGRGATMEYFYYTEERDAKEDVMEYGE